KRQELGLPLIQSGSLADVPEAVRPAYEKAYIEAAREVGGLFLADGDIARAWSYFRAIGETAPIAEALEGVQPGEGIERLIEIAFHEGVNPRKGYELILAQFGICRAISYFEQFPAGGSRDQSLELLVRTLHTELIERLQRTIERVEGQAPAAASALELMEGRDWLFEDNAYYVDTSHVISVLRFSLESRDVETLRLALELAEYGKRLGPMYQYRGEPPFEQIFADHAIYLRALLGEGIEAAIVHFRAKAAASDLEQDGTIAAQVLVDLLARLGRYGDAIDASLEYLAAEDPLRLACPSIFQLCQMSGDY